MDTQQDDSTNSGVTYNKFGVPMMAAEKTTALETSGIETLKPIETAPIIEKPTTTQQPSQDVTSQTTQTDAAQPQNIVNATTNKETLHALKSHDKNTTAADKEEEEFITNVETAHEHP